MNEGTRYEIIETKDGDPKGHTIRKHGITADFTVAGMEGEQHKLEKIIRELTAKHAHEAAVMANVEEHHPFVKKLSEQDLFTVHLYYESYALVKGLPEKIAELQAQLDGSIGEQALIAGALEIPELAERTPLETPAPAPAGEGRTPEEAQAAAIEDGSATPEAAAIENAEENAVEVSETGGPVPAEPQLANPEDAEPLAAVGQKVEWIADDGELAGVHEVTEVIAANPDAGTHAAYKTDRSTEAQKARNFRVVEEAPNDEAQA